MKKILLGIIIGYLFSISSLGAVTEKSDYREKIRSYIENNRFQSNKLSQTAIVLERFYLDSNKLEVKIIARYFIDQIQNELEYQNKHGLHVQTPHSVKALYYSAYNVSRENKIQEFIDLAKESEINALMIDITEIDGKTSFSFDPDTFGKIIPESRDQILDIKKLIERLHHENIYVIGIIVVFKDNYVSRNYPEYALKWSRNHSSIWTDYKGNSYTDPYSQDVWDYHIEIASQAYKLGFDEINFDYIRFPTDGYISDTYYPYSDNVLKENNKMYVLEEFSKYISNELKKKHPHIILSADIFGLATHTNLYQIGQNLETFIPYFDYVAPMIYPSHYGAGYLGYQVPDNAPYAIFYDSIQRAQKKVDVLNETSSGTLNIPYTKIRPWLQAFHCTWCPGATAYNKEKFRKQIQALHDLGLDSWYSWNASGRYIKDWYRD